MPPKYWSVPELWPGATFVIIGGGYSVTQQQVNLCHNRQHNGRRVRVIVINDSLRLAPWADVHYFCDDKWWRWHRQRDWYRAYQGLRITLENPLVVREEPAIKSVQNMGHKGLSSERHGVANGRNGGYQGIGLAVHMGAKRILLVGFDMHAPLEGDRTRTHWFGDHPGGTNPSVYDQMLPNFPTLIDPLKKRGIEVVNCTPGSRLDCFPRSTLAAALEEPDFTAETQRRGEEQHSLST